MSTISTVPGTEYVVYIDPRRCLGCRSCEIACAVEHSLTKNVLTAPYERPRPVPRIRVVSAKSLFVPMKCQHCRDPPCMAVCPTRAISKSEEGFVLVNTMRCIGCGMCMLVCPFGHPRFADEKFMVKCDFCIERFRRGEPPACVEACPTGALVFGRLEDVLKEVSRERAELFARTMMGLEELAKGAGEGVESTSTPQPPTLRDVLDMYSKVSWYR